MTQRPPQLSPYDQMKHDSYGVLASTISLLGQTVLYGAFAAFTPYVLWTILNQRKDRKIAKLAFYLNLFMFSLSTTYWAICISNLVTLLKMYFINQVPVQDRPLYVSLVQATAHAVILVNVVFSDVAVVWRAHAICRTYRIAFAISSFFLLMTTLAVFTTIGLRIASTVVQAKIGFRVVPVTLETAIFISQETYQGFSLLTNLTATAAIGWKFIKYKDAFNVFNQNDMKPSPTIKNALALLIESGVIFCMSTIFTLIGRFITLPNGTLQDIYVPMHAQIASMYPSAIFVLVYQRDRMRSAISTKTAVSLQPRVSNEPSTLENMDFRPVITTNVSERVMPFPNVESIEEERSDTQKFSRKMDENAARQGAI